MDDVYCWNIAKIVKFGEIRVSREIAKEFFAELCFYQLMVHHAMTITAQPLPVQRIKNFIGYLKNNILRHFMHKHYKFIFICILTGMVA